MRERAGWLVGGMAAALLILGGLRAVGTRSGVGAPWASLVTPAYVLVVVVFGILLVRAELPLNRLGFGERLAGRHLMLAIGGLLALHVASVALEPHWEAVLGGPRDLERFSGVEGSPGPLIGLLALNWTFAAFGEEITFRIILMRGISFALGDTRAAKISALLAQAVLFGLVHLYQGGVGVAGTATSGLIYGSVTLAARWSIWPAALAHGLHNTIGIWELYRGVG